MLQLKFQERDVLHFSIVRGICLTIAKSCTNTEASQDCGYCTAQCSLKMRPFNSLSVLSACSYEPE